MNLSWTPTSKADPSEWGSALNYYRDRRVLFLSYCRFWEPHGFVQQSLARTLANAGVSVVWLDGAGWRPYRPVVPKIKNLRVSQLMQLPLRRLDSVSKWDLERKSRRVRQWIKQLGGNPVIWVQGGLDEAVVEGLPYVDVFSVFDDPYRHAPSDALCSKAKVILCQNQTAQKILAGEGCSSYLLHPPMEIAPKSVLSEVALPEGFPDKRMGYIGSFFSDGFDFDLFEDFISSFEEWGFVLAGRTDALGLETIQRWGSLYPRFHYIPWVPREQVGALWDQLDLTLLFYRPFQSQDGAFPVKVLESLQHGVPCLATAVPKTADLEGIFPRANSPEDLKRAVPVALSLTSEQLSKFYEGLASEMNPTHHLTQVAQWLQG